MLKKIITLFMLCLLSLGALADEAKVKAMVEEKLGGTVTSITKSPYLNLYEVFVDGQIFYTDEKVSAILVGSLIDGQTMQNVTAERMQELTAVKFSELPLELAIKQTKGDGSRIMATFEDPNCGFCKRLAKEVAQLDNVTYYTFLFPILSPDSLEKTKRIWCSDDRARAWNDWILNGKEPPAAKANCDTSAIQKVAAFGQKLAISSVPTIIFGNGDRVSGALSKAELEEKLNAAPSKGASKTSTKGTKGAKEQPKKK